MASIFELSQKALRSGSYDFKTLKYHPICARCGMSWASDEEAYFCCQKAEDDTLEMEKE